MTRAALTGAQRAELESRVRLLDAAVTTLGDGLFAFDAEERLSYWSRRMADLSRLEGLEVLGRGVRDAFGDSLTEEERDHVHVVLSGHSAVSRNSRLASAFGGKTTCDVHYVPIVSDTGGVLAGAAIVRDTTAQRHAEALALETELRFKNMADASPVLLWMADPDGLCTFFNQTWLDFTGRTLEEEWGVGWAEGVHHEDFQRCLDTYLEAFNARRRFEMEYRLRRADGAYRWVLDHGTPRFSPRGEFAGYIGSCVDISDRKRVEVELRRAVKDRDEFLSIAAHELRTPLTALQLQLESLERAVVRQGPDPDRLRKAAQSTMRQTRRLSGLVEQLLDVSRLTVGRVDLSPERMDLVALVSEVVDRFQPMAKEAGCVLAVVSPPRIPGRWDRARLDQILSNLVSNAVKYAPGRPVELVVAARGGRATVKVRDQGMGIPKADQQRIFERFERAVPSHQYGGFGLGLWITRQLVEAHGGAISVESAPGEGAEFAVDLPCET